MKRFYSLLAMGLLAAASCTAPETPQPGMVYEITFPDGNDSGVAVFETAGEQMTGTYYADNGRLYADEEPVTLKTDKGRLRMVFTDDSERKFSFKPYKAPVFKEFPERLPYRDSAYSVIVDTNITYADHVKGYFTSYPKRPGRSFSQIYRDTLETVINGLQECILTLDLYRPEGGGAMLRPLFLMIHGGAFYYEDKADPEYEAWCRYFAARGYVAASINYRLGFGLSEEETTRAAYRALQDAHAAARFLVGSREYHIDPKRVFVAGNSAGAITALNLAFMGNDDRPESTKGGMLSRRINKYFKLELRDLGPINGVNPKDTTHFSIRAVANMWGAILDTDILRNAETSIVSFHSKNDPTVPFGYDYPFRDYFQKGLFDSVEDGSFIGKVIEWTRARERANGYLFDRMYGSEKIDQKARALGLHSVLYKYDEKKHSLHLDGNALNARFYEITEKMADFFSREMEPTPVNLCLEGIEGPWVRINASAVKQPYWQVEGGVVREMQDDGIRVLLFQDAGRRSVTVSGQYEPSRTTFRESLEL